MMAGLAAADVPARPLHAVLAAQLESFLAGLPSAQAAYLRDAGFSAAAGSVMLLPGPSGVAGAVLGLGEAPASPWTYGSAPAALPSATAWRLEGSFEPSAALLGWLLGAYRFERYRAPAPPPARLVPPADGGDAAAFATAMCRARDLINTPANDLGPAELAAAVGTLAAAHGAACEIIEGAALAAGFPALATVGQASTRAPRVAVLRWGEPAHPLVALCGKGVCFDTGGLDLKPSSAMLRMKKDMGGAACMLALAEAIMATRLPVRLLLLIGAVENAVSGNAFRPMDVIRTRAGISVEIGNTDAEGRLMLADLLCFAAEQRPALLLDAATLTGAARVALGPDLPVLFCNNESLAATLLESAQRVHDPMWRLPLHDGYTPWLDSSIAETNNVSAKPMAGAIVAALFLRRFVPASVPWGHLDLYAWNDATRPGRPEGGEAQSVRGLHAGIISCLPNLKARMLAETATVTN